MAPAAMTGMPTPRTSSRTTQGTGSPAGCRPLVEQVAAPDQGLGAHERDARGDTERGAVEDVVEALVLEQHERPGDHEDHRHDGRDDPAHQGKGVPPPPVMRMRRPRGPRP